MEALQAEIEELQECCLDLRNRLNAAEARETELASDLVSKDKEMQTALINIAAIQTAAEAQAAETSNTEEALRYKSHFHHGQQCSF